MPQHSSYFSFIQNISPYNLYKYNHITYAYIELNRLHIEFSTVNKSPIFNLRIYTYNINIAKYARFIHTHILAPINTRDQTNKVALKYALVHLQICRLIDRIIFSQRQPIINANDPSIILRIYEDKGITPKINFNFIRTFK